MDDVGQTLLNWASAFGTQEMVKTRHSTLHTLLCPDFDLFLCDLSDPVAFCLSRWSFSVKEGQTLTGVRGLPRFTTPPVLDVHKLPR